MGGPGSFGSIMPGGDDATPRRFKDLERALRENTFANTAAATQIGSGGLLVNNGGSITIQGTGSLNVGSGALNSAGSITAGTSIVAGTTINAAGNIHGGGLISDTGITAGADIAATGNVSAGGNVSASGQVVSAGPLKSPGSYAYVVHLGSWVASWIDSDGTVGTSPSSSLVKTGLTQMTAADARKLLNLTPYWGRYVWDAPDIPPRVFFLAEDVQAAGFGPDVVPTVTDKPLSMLMPDGSPVLDATGAPVVIPIGHAFTVNYSQMVVPLVAAWQDGAAQMQVMRDQMAALQSQMAALQAQVNPPPPTV